VNDALAPLGVELTELPITPTPRSRRVADTRRPMKAAPFEHARPASVTEAISLLLQNPAWRVCWPEDSR